MLLAKVMRIHPRGILNTWLHYAGSQSLPNTSGQKFQVFHQSIDTRTYVRMSETDSEYGMSYWTESWVLFTTKRMKMEFLLNWDIYLLMQSFKISIPAILWPLLANTIRIQVHDKIGRKILFSLKKISSVFKSFKSVFFSNTHRSSLNCSFIRYIDFG